MRVPQRRDGLIRVEASDNVMVTKVVVTILNVDGNVIEKGEAVKVDERWWEYAAGMEGKVAVEAWDLAGNVVRGIL